MAEVGAAANLLALVGTGTRLSLVIFDLASRIGSAGIELDLLGKEISLFCSVTKQLQTLLANASFKYSSSAIDTAQEVVEQCSKILEKIDDTISGLLRLEGPEGIPSVAFVSKVKWTFKKPKIEMMRSALESSKLTLHIMLTTMTFAENVSKRRTSSTKTEAEDKQDHIITRGLILSQQREVERLIRLEDDLERAAGSVAETRPGRNYASLSEAPSLAGRRDSMARKSANRVSRLLKGLNPISTTSSSSIDLSQIQTPQRQQERPITKTQSQPVGPPADSQVPKPPTRVERASAWLKLIIDANYQDPFNPHPGQPKKRLSSTDTAELPMLLLRKWTDQAERLEQLKQEARTHGKHISVESLSSEDVILWDQHPEFNFKFPPPHEQSRGKSAAFRKEEKSRAGDCLVCTDNKDGNATANDNDDDDDDVEPIARNLATRSPPPPARKDGINLGNRCISFDQPVRVPTDSMSPTNTTAAGPLAASARQQFLVGSPTRQQSFSATPISLISPTKDNAPSAMFFNTAPPGYMSDESLPLTTTSPQPLPKIIPNIAFSEGGISNDTATTAITTSSSSSSDEDDLDPGEESGTDASCSSINLAKPHARSPAGASSSSAGCLACDCMSSFPCATAISATPSYLKEQTRFSDSTSAQEMLTHLIRRYSLPSRPSCASSSSSSSSCKYELRLTYGGQQRALTPNEKPLVMIRRFDEVGLHPVLLLQHS